MDGERGAGPVGGASETERGGDGAHRRAGGANRLAAAVLRRLLPGGAERLRGVSLREDAVALAAQALTSHPDSAKRLAEEAGRRIQAVLDGREQWLEIRDDGGIWPTGPAERADLCIRGSAQDWVRAAMGLRSALEVAGDASLASRLHFLIEGGRPGPEQVAASWIGPGAGRLAGRLAGQLAGLVDGARGQQGGARSLGLPQTGAGLRQAMTELAAEALEQERRLQKLDEALRRQEEGGA